MNLDNVFSDNSKGSTSCLYRTLPAYLPRGDSVLNLSRVGIPPENVSSTTVLASRPRYHIIMSDTGPTYARQLPTLRNLGLEILKKTFPTNLELKLLS